MYSTREYVIQLFLMRSVICITEGSQASFIHFIHLLIVYGVFCYGLFDR